MRFSVDRRAEGDSERRPLRRNLTRKIGCADSDQRARGSQKTTSNRVWKVNVKRRFVQHLRTSNCNIKVIVLV